MHRGFGVCTWRVYRGYFGHMYLWPMYRGYFASSIGASLPLYRTHYSRFPSN